MFEALSRAEVLVGIVGFLTTILVPALYRRRGKIFYDIVAEFCFFDRESEDKAKDILFAGRRIASNPKVFVIDLRNDWGTEPFGMIGGLGGVDIPPDKYERAISFDFGNKAQILDAEILEETPPTIREFICTYANKVLLKPVLLNHGDLIRVKVVVENPNERVNLLSGLTGTIDVDGRIIGIRDIQRAWSTLKFLLVANQMLFIGGSLLVFFDFLLPILLGYPPFEGHPFFPNYRGIFSALWGFFGSMLVGGILLEIVYFARVRVSSDLEKQIRASYFKTPSK